MTLETRKQAFANLGSFLMQFTSEDLMFSSNERAFAKQMSKAITAAIQHNGWFTKESIYFSLNQWGKSLSVGRLNQWLDRYDLTGSKAKTVAVIMAGNVPLVGFHDFMTVLLSGHKVLVKQSSKDKFLLPCLVKLLISENSEFADLVEFTDDRLNAFDAVIATGSDNTARYFEYYFAKKPHIIRKNRNSVAVLTGQETERELKLI